MYFTDVFREVVLYQKFSTLCFVYRYRLVTEAFFVERLSFVQRFSTLCFVYRLVTEAFFVERLSFVQRFLN